MSTIHTTIGYDASIEAHVMRRYGLLGRGSGMGNGLYAIDYNQLPPEARVTINLIINNGPFYHPENDGTIFGNFFGDLPRGEYLEYTVPTPRATSRAKRRIVARRRTGQLFFTACHYERVQVSGQGTQAEKHVERVAVTATLDAAFRNGFYIITGLSAELRQQITSAIKALG